MSPVSRIGGCAAWRRYATRPAKASIAPMPKTRLAGRRSPVFFRGVGARPSTPFGPQAPVLADAPRTYLHRSKGARVGTLALALPKDTPAQSAGAGSGRCARPPHSPAPHVLCRCGVHSTHTCPDRRCGECGASERSASGRPGDVTAPIRVTKHPWRGRRGLRQVVGRRSFLRNRREGLRTIEGLAHS